MLVPIDDADVPRIVAFMNRAYRGVAAGWSTESGFLAGQRTSEALLREELAGDPGGALLKWIEPDGMLIGCVRLEPVGDDTWYLGSLTIDPDRENAGLGRRLLAAAEAWARVRGALRIRMRVIHLRDALIAWYGRRGYRPTGETSPFPYGDERFGTPLRDDLSFVVLEKAFGQPASNEAVA